MTINISLQMFLNTEKYCIFENAYWKYLRGTIQELSGLYGEFRVKIQLSVLTDSWVGAIPPKK